MRGKLVESNLKGSLAVVCHDAGSANIIVSWLNNMTLYSVRAHMKGPAYEIWCRAFPNIATLSLEEVFTDCSILISGTGWASDLEHNARIQAASLKVYSVAVIDHWTNYEERFTRNGLVQLPDEICVTDQYAYSLVKKLMPRVEVSLIPNSYLEEQVRVISSLEKDISGVLDEDAILYILEPIRVNWGVNDPRAGEFQALDYFVSNLKKVSCKNVKIRIRPHPSDIGEKYRSWVNKQTIEIEISEDSSLAEDICWSDIVVGCQSYALVIALAAQKRVFSSLPPSASELVLPFPEIRQLRFIEEKII